MSKAIKISLHPGKGLYRKTIGKALTADGTKQPRQFWLGDNQVKALYLATALTDYWDTRLDPHGLVWTKEHEHRARLLASVFVKTAQSAVNEAAATVNQLVSDGFPVQVPAIVTPSADAPTFTPGLTLKTAAERYMKTLKAKQLGEKYTTRAEQVHKQIFEVLPANTPVTPMIPTRDQLLNFVSHFLARPVSKLTGKPMAVLSVKTVFQHTKALLETLEDEGWECRGWRKLFKVRWTALLTPAEQRKAAAGKDTFTTQELVDLYELANDRQRMLLLLGLNTAMAQKEISTLLRDDIELKAGKIARIRNKTRATAAVKAEWILWPETARALKRQMAGENDAGLALLTEDGNPLVNDATDTDSVALTWTRLLKTAKRAGKNVRPLSFGTLRKTSATWMLNHGGRELQQLHLAHADGSVAAKHYTGEVSYERLHDALNQYHEELRKAGLFIAGTRPAKAVKAKTVSGTDAGTARFVR